ncbi:symmetrical bis(5'-nucleosyl)-tetraphosphatase [Atopomonas sediminilitoris]|uniref:symmetrical bis(5'-nucleosyl)-tetraphosphatase n=1 Tax=Atopomonas sediminilitoris TaxID=2919919 RepID=UPI001F4EB415|nr:symmetrical bis(5'-nucleosyl)-tetraphosphatase [Atopomonas sediminilitoris]MCJ8170291.1 symmetrical bis(5'-nucleosyl)-tetraphosphatase [Atopomonas sediminilitoris]
MTHYAVGDLQGCLEPLHCLLKRVDFSPSRDTLWVAGDMVNRGPQSLETLRYLRGLGNAVVAVLGNHDLHLIACALVDERQRRSDTLRPILEAPDSADLIDWLRMQPLMHDDRRLGFSMVHAGVPPQWSREKALKRAAEVQYVLRDQHAITDFLRQMYGNLPARWDKKLQGVERLRLITNYFTRMRFTHPDGTLDLTSKEGLDSAPEGFAPWFSHPRAMAGERLIFGHWAALEGQCEVPGLFALDTGCVWGGRLTLLNLHSEERLSCACKPRESA